MIANVTPGTYSVNLEHESLVCDNARAWLVETPNEYTVLVVADAVTVSYINCTGG